MKRYFSISVIVFTFFFYLIHFQSYSQATKWLWARSPDVQQNPSHMAFSTAVDAAGNIYNVGGFSDSTITFGSYTLINTDADHFNLFLVKYDAYGNVLWAKSVGGMGFNNMQAAFANSVSVDVSGNVYIAGYFSFDTLYFGSVCIGNDTNNITEDLFLAKYDSDGNVLWAKSAGGFNYDAATSIATDAIGNIYLTGWFRSPTINFGSVTLTNDTTDGGADIFLAKYDTNGNLLWAKSAGGSVDDFANSVVVDASGSIYLAGEFDSPSIIFGFTTLINIDVNGNHYYDIILVKYDSSGNVVWAKNTIGGAINNGNNNCGQNSIALDTSGNAYMAGNFVSDTIIFGSTVLTNSGGSDIFLAKYDTEGNVLWAKSAGTGGIEASTVAVDVSGNAYVAGDFNDPIISFGPYIITCNGIHSDIFLAKYDPNGNVLWAKSAGGSRDEGVMSVTVDTSENVYITGSWDSDTLNFGVTSLINMFGAYNIRDCFLAKLGKCSVDDSYLHTASCSGSNDGSATVIATGGNPPYTYLWNSSPVQTTATVTSLAAGIYNVIVTDSSGCSRIDTMTVNEIPAPNAYAWNDTIICEGIKDTLHVSGGISYLWSNNDTTQNIVVGVAATTTFTVTVTGTNGCTAFDSVVVTIDKPVPTITCYSSVIECNESYLFYQWHLNGNIIIGAISQTYVPLQNGSYAVEITDSIGCSATSSPCTFTNDIEPFSENNSIIIYPNPATNNLTIETSAFAKDQTISVYNIQGQLLLQQSFLQSETEIDISMLAKGMYIIRLSSGAAIALKKFVKQ